MAVNTEKSVNTLLGEIIRARHPRWRNSVFVEQTQILADAPGKSPDIVIDGSISPVVVETEFEPATTVEADARSRLGANLAATGKEIEHVFACRLPANLKTIPQSELKTTLEQTAVSFRVVSLGLERQEQVWPKENYCSGGIDDLIDCIDVVGLSESLVDRCTTLLEEGLTNVQHILVPSSARLGEVLCQEPGEQTNRMAAAIIANALIFHISIETREDIPNLLELMAENESNVLFRDTVFDCWNWIIRNVNYWPIFNLASGLLKQMQLSIANRTLNELYKTVQELEILGAQNLNDLSGRLFQRLIADRKFLATFYTLPVSATLLSELVTERLSTDWSIPNEITSLRIADWACGTGTLIGAMYRSIASRHRKHANDENIHAAMMEHVLYAFDIMPAATHLTSSTLSSVHCGSPFRATKVVTMPYGELVGYSAPQIGSLELLSNEDINPLFSLRRAVLSGEGNDDNLIHVSHGSVDVVIMNPPFTRPTNHERVTSGEGIPVPSFAAFNTPANEQRAMAARLKDLLKKCRVYGPIASHGNAGLASNFIDLAHAKLAPGGVLGLVLPFTFVQGLSWQNARSILETQYKDVLVISIATEGNSDRAFSADTSMAEVLVIATKRDNEDETPFAIQYVNLINRPFHQIEAMMLGRQISHGELPFGSYIDVDSFEQGGFAAIRNVRTLGLAATSLANGRLELPHGVVADIPIISMGELGKRGLHVLDINGHPSKPGDPPRGPFERRKLTEDDAYPVYPTLWEHNASRETNIFVAPDSVCEAKTGRDQHANQIWRDFASRLHLTVDFQLNSQAFVGCLTQKPTIGGRAWPNFVLENKDFERICVLWLNSTLGLISFWMRATRTQQGRASMTVSRHTELLSLDPRELSENQIKQFERLFVDISERTFLPANEAYRDDARKELDEVILGDILNGSSAILRELDLLRSQWCAEPSVHGGKSTRLSRA